MGLGRSCNASGRWLAALILLGAVFLSPANAAAAGWGAIALGFAPSGKFEVCGRMWDAPTKADADRLVLDACKSHKSPRIGVSFQGGAGAVLIHGQTHVAEGKGATAQAAIDDAKTRARDRNGVKWGENVYIYWLVSGVVASNQRHGEFPEVFNLPDRRAYILHHVTPELIGTTSRFYSDAFNARTYDLSPFRYQRAIPNTLHAALIFVVTPRSAQAIAAAAQTALLVGGIAPNSGVARFAFSPADFPGGAQETVVIRDVTSQELRAGLQAGGMEGTTFLERKPGLTQDHAFYVRRVYMVVVSGTAISDDEWRGVAMTEARKIIAAQHGANHRLVMPGAVR
jgi:hypothetical protein